ncbi:BMP family ABC transporter substrate-binding protein [Leucobacter sp. M11]|uniref:BMP family ABC transporter substrate-binding protein n=1 Tax=Leucobacter sp. M11 TaxID=2993565 RepID=UPI002D7F35B0|nr:BMP family ABC transporter substrate-binding protein [Leucobacter sp. M11]MEB4615762.1 BMP family ABC transporter substrate-binding protein [Leucobacter sp. M11]
MLKKTALVAGLASAALLMTGCAGGGDAASGDNFVYITSDPIGVNEFLKSGDAGIKEAAKRHGGESKTFESRTDEERRSNLEAAVGENPAVTVMLGFQFEDMAVEFAEQYPDQKFLLIDAPAKKDLPNLYSATFREQEPSYLLGVEAGSLTKSGNVGSVISLDIPLLQKYAGGFYEGAQSVNSDLAPNKPQVIGGDNPFADTARAKEQALAFVSGGADQVFAVGAAANGGIMEAAAEKGFFAYGVDANQCQMAPGNVVDGTIKAVDVVVNTVVDEIIDGKAPKDATSSFGLKEGGMNIVSLTDDAAESGCTVMDNPELLETVKQAKDDIVSGKVTVTDPSA